MINLGEYNNYVTEQNKDTGFGTCFKWIQFSKCHYRNPCQLSEVKWSQQAVQIEATISNR
jgi:hypothetical protein